MTINVNVEYLEHYKKEDWGELIYQHEGDAGFDLRVCGGTETMILHPGERKLVPTGIKLEIPMGHHIEIRPRSGMCLEYGVTVLNSPGTIDSGYRGEIKVLLINLGNDSIYIHRGDRIAQAVLIKHDTAQFIISQLSDTSRGVNGFGSTGI